LLPPIHPEHSRVTDVIYTATISYLPALPFKSAIQRVIKNEKSIRLDEEDKKSSNILIKRLINVEKKTIKQEYTPCIKKVEGNKDIKEEVVSKNYLKAQSHRTSNLGGQTFLQFENFAQRLEDHIIVFHLP